MLLPSALLQSTMLTLSNKASCPVSARLFSARASRKAVSIQGLAAVHAVAIARVSVTYVEIYQEVMYDLLGGGEQCGLIDRTSGRKI